MARNHYPRVIRCHICGSELSTTAARSMCEDCRKARYLEAHRRNYYKNKPKHTMTRGEIFIIYDPLDISEGGYGVGHVFDLENHKLNLQARNYYPGLRYKNYYGKVFEIVSEKGVMKEMPCLSA